MNPAGGWIAGATVGPNATIVDATLWNNQAPQLLPALSNYAQSVATAVNDSGAAVGVAFDMNLEMLTPGPVPGSDAHAVLFTNSPQAAVTDLGVLQGDKSSMALGINSSGWVVGFSDRQAPSLGLNLVPILTYPTGDYRAFLYANGTMYDLNNLIEGGNPGWQLCFAVQVNNAGQIVGTGFHQGQQRAFLLTPVAGPQITGIGGAAGSVPPVTSASSNSLVSIYGSAFAATSVSHLVTKADLVNGALPTNVENVCVQGGNNKWGLLYVSPMQINALAGQMPTSGTVPVTVISNCGTGNDLSSAAFNLTAAAAPEFLYFLVNANGQNPVAAVQNSTGQYVGSPGLITGATFAPAHAGDVLVAFGVGWGATNSTDPIGTLATAAASVTGSYSLKLGDQDVTPLYVGLTPGFAGLYQVDFVIPTLPAGNQSLVLTVNGAPTPSGGYITIAQ